MMRHSASASRVALAVAIDDLLLDFLGHGLHTTIQRALDCAIVETRRTHLIAPRLAPE
jgi:hypothetical protein